jgi:polyphosphate kinase 2 (PPK2 family)
MKNKPAKKLPPRRAVADEGSKPKLGKKDYEKELLKLQGELCALQDWVLATKQKIIIIFEGRDAAGKGGTIKAITERVSPRVFRVVALPAPSDREKTQVYGQRYITHFPAGGEVVIFDRSWYNRAGVEYVMGFCTQQEHDRFLELLPEFEENMIVDNGIILLKYWLEVSDEEQERLSGRASTIRCVSGNCRPWTCPRASAGTTTRTHVTSCWRPPTPILRPGTSSIPTTRSGRA